MVALKRIVQDTNLCILETGKTGNGIEVLAYDTKAKCEKHFIFAYSDS